MQQDAIRSRVTHDVLKRNPVRHRKNDLIAVVDQDLNSIEQRMFAANRGYRLFLTVVGIKVGGVTTDDRIAQLGGAANRGVLRKIVLNRGNRGIFDVLRGGEMRLARAEIHNINPLAAQLLSLSYHCHRGRRFDAIDPFSESDRLIHFRRRRGHDFFLFLVSVDCWNRSDGSSFSCSRCSTLSGTKPLMEPPNCAISRTSRELRYE